jgi:hypothetical protein
MTSHQGPLPEWTMAGYGGPYEAVDPGGVAWRLWHAEKPSAADPHPAGYRLAPVDDLDIAEYVTADRGLYHALDMAGMRIAADAVRDDPEGAVLQLGLDPR